MFGNIRDLNSTGMGIKSIGGSSDGKMNKSILNLEPTIGTGILKRQAGGSLPAANVSKGGLTASALRNLDNKSTNSKGILKSDAGRTADRKVEGMSRGSKKSQTAEVVYDREEINRNIEKIQLELQKHAREKKKIMTNTRYTQSTMKEKMAPIKALEDQKKFDL